MAKKIKDWLKATEAPGEENCFPKPYTKGSDKTLDDMIVFFEQKGVKAVVYQLK
jgi:hypothetical protein